LRADVLAEEKTPKLWMRYPSYRQNAGSHQHQQAAGF
jgi:hypothetical protein